MSKSFELISNFWSELEKTRKSISHFGGYDGFCQCETEKVIAKTSNPTETRSFLLVGMLIDQSVREQYVYPRSDFYAEFRSVFTYPRLVAHFDGSEHSCSWFCYHVHGYDKLVNWENVEKVSEILLVETKNWILDHFDPPTYKHARNSILGNIEKISERNLRQLN